MLIKDFIKVVDIQNLTIRISIESYKTNNIKSSYKGNIIIV